MTTSTKHYRHRTPGARFILPDGRELCFIGGTFRTEDSAIQQELDKVTNVPASQIYTTPEPIKAVEEVVMTSELMQGATKAFDSENKITAPTETIPIPIRPEPKPMLQQPAPAQKSALDRAKEALAKGKAS